MTTAAAATAKEIAIVRTAELLELERWEHKYAIAKARASATEKEVKFRRLALAEKVLGVKTEDELKTLSPAQVENRLAKRLEAGDWKAERGAPAFTFLKTNQGRYPSWSELFAAKVGETAAEQIRVETPTTYSYRVQVSP